VASELDGNPVPSLPRPKASPSSLAGKAEYKLERLPLIDAPSRQPSNRCHFTTCGDLPQVRGV